MQFPTNLQPSLPFSSHAEPELFTEQLADPFGPLGPKDRQAAPEGAPIGAIAGTAPSGAREDRQARSRIDPARISQS